jgi:hypothetical protein
VRLYYAHHTYQKQIPVIEFVVLLSLNILSPLETRGLMARLQIPLKLFTGTAGVSPALTIEATVNQLAKPTE